MAKGELEGKVSVRFMSGVQVKMRMMRVRVRLRVRVGVRVWMRTRMRMRSEMKVPRESFCEILALKRAMVKRVSSSPLMKHRYFLYRYWEMIYQYRTQLYFK